MVYHNGICNGSFGFHYIHEYKFSENEINCLNQVICCYCRIVGNAGFEWTVSRINIETVTYYGIPNTDSEKQSWEMYACSKANSNFRALTLSCICINFAAFFVSTFTFPIQLTVYSFHCDWFHFYVVTSLVWIQLFTFSTGSLCFYSVIQQKKKMKLVVWLECRKEMFPAPS